MMEILEGAHDFPDVSPRRRKARQIGAIFMKFGRAPATSMTLNADDKELSPRCY